MQIGKLWFRDLALPVFGCCILSFGGSVVQAQDVPKYRVDPSWPKMPLPNKWIMQGIPDLVVDSSDHIWVVSRPKDANPDEIGAASTPPRTDCCIAAPAVLEFVQDHHVGRSLQNLACSEIMQIDAREAAWITL